MALNFAPFRLAGRRVVLLADGEFSTFGAKTATCYLRYRTNDVVAVVDRTKAGQTVGDVVGFGGDIPVVPDIHSALSQEPEIAIVGVAPVGGGLDEHLKAQVLECLTAKVDVVSGLHDFLSRDTQVEEAARGSGAGVWDVRQVPPTRAVGSGLGCTTGATSVLLVGSDCNVGKMTATVELYNEALSRDLNVGWAATGQTGMMLRERGLAVDRVVADFIGGATEELINYEGRDRDLVLVEGQGSIVHPGYAGVTLGLLYGAMPDCMVLVHAPSREHIGDSDFPMPPLNDLIGLYEGVMKPLKESPVVAIAMNTAGFESEVARDIIAHTKRETGLPVGDPVRFGSSEILEAVLDGVA